MYNNSMKIDFCSYYERIDTSAFNNIFKALSKKVEKDLALKKQYFLEVDLVDDDEIQRINKEYRQIDRPTDVISFAFLDRVNGEISIKNASTVFLGEIVISVDKAEKQAHDYAHSLEREMAFLFVHGLLHLLGYDHNTKENEKIMFGIQDRILEDSKWKKKS